MTGHPNQWSLHTKTTVRGSPAGVMLAVAAINGWLAYQYGSMHPIMAFLHAAMALAMVLAVGIVASLGR